MMSVFRLWMGVRISQEPPLPNPSPARGEGLMARRPLTLPPRRGEGLGVVAHAEGGDEGFLGDADAAVFAHAFLALFLLLEELALARRVAAVAFGGDVLAQRGNRFAGDDLAADRGLDRDLEQMARDELLQALAHDAAARFGIGAVDDHRERVDRLAVDQDAHLD